VLTPWPEDASSPTDTAASPTVVVASAGGRHLVSTALTQRCVAGDPAMSDVGGRRALDEATLVVGAMRHGVPLVTVDEDEERGVTAMALDDHGLAEGGAVRVAGAVGRLDGEGEVELSGGGRTTVERLVVPTAPGVRSVLVRDLTAGRWRTAGTRTEQPGGQDVRHRAIAPSALGGHRDEFVSACAGLLDGTPASRSVKVRPGELLDDRCLWPLDRSQIDTLAPAVWSRILGGLGAPAALVASGLDPSDAEEVLLGYEMEDRRPTHKLYVVVPTEAAYRTMSESLGHAARAERPVFLSVKWRPDRPDQWWTAEYRLPAPAVSARSVIEASFVLPRDWAWAHALTQLTAPAVLRGVAEADAGRDRVPSMHTANLLVMTDSRGRTSVDVRARRAGRAGPPLGTEPVLTWLAGVAGLDRSSEDRLVAFVSGGLIERAIAGTDASGEPFLSLYRAPTGESGS
jgi:hypothetical protein